MRAGESRFVWYDLMTNDPAGARAFYAGIAGWTTSQMGDYTMWKAIDREIGGLGIFLVREMCDDIAYHHDPHSGWNELTVIKLEGNGNV